MSRPPGNDGAPGRGEESEQRLGEQRLGEEGFRAMIEHAPDVITLLDEEGTILYQSPSVGRVLGYGAGELVGEHAFGHVHPEDRERAFRVFARAAREGGDVETPVPYRFRCKDGSWRHLEGTGSNRLSTPGVGALVVNSRDIAGQVEAEKALRQSEERYRTLAETIPAITYVRGVVGKGSALLYISPQVEAVLGYSPEEFGAAPGLWKELIHPEDRGRVLSAEARTARTGEPFRAEYRALARDGRRVWLRDEAVVVRGPEGEPLSRQGVAFDVSARREAEESLQRERNLLRTVIDSTRDIIFAKDTEHRFVLNNTAHLRALGTESQRELLGKTNAHYWGEERTGPFHEDDRQVMETGEPVVAREEWIPLASGGQGCFSTTKVPLLGGPGGLVEGLVAVSRDITDRRRDEEALRESERRLAEAQSLTGVGSWEWELASDSVSWSDQQYRNFGLAPGEFEPTFEGFLEHVHPDDRDHITRAHGESLAEGGLFEWEYRLVRPDGEVRDIHTRGRTFTDEREEPLRMAGTDHDITERKAAEEARLQSEERFRQLFEQSVEALIVHDSEGRIADVNSETCNSLGYTRQELLERSISDLTDDLLTPEERREREQRGGTLWQRIVAGHPAARNVVHHGNHKRKDGTTFPIEVRVGGVDYGSERMILASVRDVTEREQAEEATRESEARFRQLFEQSVEALLVHDEEGRYVDVNAQACRLYGYSREELLGLSVHDVVCEMLTGEEKDRRHREGGTLWQRVMSGEPGVFAVSFEDENKQKDGSTFTAEVRLGSVDYGGRRLMLVAVRDITERKRAEEALQKSEQRLRAVTDGAPVILFALDRKGVFTFEAGAGLEALGAIPGQSVGRSVFEAYPQYPEVIENVRRALDGEEVATTVDLRGFAFAVRYSPILSEAGLVEGIIGVATDITDRRELERGLEHQALHDPLTGLANRDLALRCMEQALARTRRTGGHAAVLFVDLDNFKVINDSLGHEAGDCLLSAIAGRLRECVRQADIAARIGGDEFLVVLDTVDGDAEAEEIARRIHETLCEPYTLLQEEVFIGLSIGIAVDDAAGEGAGELLRRADLAMYRAKTERQISHKVFDPGMDREVRERMAMENDLRRALSEGEFELYYQPKVCLEDGSLMAFEALLRWNHPERGLLLPADFLPVAEDLGLTVPLGRWVLGEACRQRREWQDLYPGAGSVKVCVNVSGKQLEQPGFAEEVSGVLWRNGLEPGALGLELTEGAFIGEDARTADALSELKRMGVILIIDDFGIGYSSLSYLKRLPVQFLKIDPSFTEELGKRDEQTTMVRAILEISHAYGIRVTAEGIETAEQLSLLREMGCDLAQGYYFEAALPASGATTWLSARQA